MSLEYRVLKKQVYTKDNRSLIPIRMEDRFLIMKWRNEQIYHLRQNRLLTKEEQNQYFHTVISNLFDKESPEQLLFSYLDGEKCVGYGGLVHINWIDMNAEISFIMDTNIEKSFFEIHWTTFLQLIENVAFSDLGLHKIFTYAFNMRPQLYSILESNGFKKEGTLKEQVLIDKNYFDVIVHSKMNNV